MARARMLLPPLLLLLLPATRGTTCSTPMSIEHANIRVKSYDENSRERYICNSGFKRKAGTSSLTKCLRNEDTNTTEWTIPSLKCIKLTFTSKSDVTVATEQAVTPGAELRPSEPPPAGSTGTVKREPSRAPPWTTAEVVEHTPTSFLDEPGVHSDSFTGVTVAIPTLAVLCGAAAVMAICVVCCRRSRQTSWTPSVEMENIEDVPMTGGTDGREDTENYHAV